MASLLIVGCTSKPVMNLNDVYVPSTVTGQQHSIDDVQTAILTAAEQRGWSARVNKNRLDCGNPFCSNSYRNGRHSLFCIKLQYRLQK